MGQIGIGVGIVLLWSYASGRWFSELFLSPPADVGGLMWAWVKDGSLWYHSIATFHVALAGFLAGSVAALILGVLFGRVKVLGELFEPYIAASYSIPRIALIPLLILWFGIGFKFRVITASILVFFLMFYSVYGGVREVSPKLVNAVRVMGGDRWDVVRYVILPSALVWIATGLKTSIPYALVGAVVSEMFAGNRGLGYLVARHAAQFNSAGTFAALGVLLIVGFTANSLAELASRRSLRWKDE